MEKFKCQASFLNFEAVLFKNMRSMIKYHYHFILIFFSALNPKDWLNVELAGIFPVLKILAKLVDKSYLEK